MLTVAQIKSIGVVVQSDTPLTSVTPGARYQVYRVVNGQSHVVGTGLVRKAMGNGFKLNPDSDNSLSGVVVGDLVQAL